MEGLVVASIFSRLAGSADKSSFNLEYTVLISTIALTFWPCLAFAASFKTVVLTRRECALALVRERRNCVPVDSIDAATRE